MFPQELNLRDLVTVEDWQTIQDSFSEVLEISLRTLSLEGKLLTRISRPNRLCSEILLPAPSYSNFCGNCLLRTDIEQAIEVEGRTNFQCPFGLDVFVVPITAVGNKTVAYIAIGPVILNRRKDAAEYAEEAEKLGIKLEQLLDTLIEINVFSYNKIYSVTKLVKDIFSHIAQAGYHKKRLGELAPELIEMDPLFSRYYEEKILNSLLNSCLLALEADSGSVMTLDKKTNMLHIKVASKLDASVVQNTNIKVGEGIAGVAAATCEPIILPKDGDKNGLSKRMKRGYIKSSMIVPFNRRNSQDVYGVINLNMVRKSVNFSKNDIAFVQEIINLVSIALLPLQKKSPPD